MRKDFALKFLSAKDMISRPRGATIRELQDALGISVSTVYRILDMLQEFGIPIYKELDVDGRTNQKRWKCLDRRNDGGDSGTLIMLDQKERMLLSLLLKNGELLNSGDLSETVQALNYKLQRHDVLRPNDRSPEVHVQLARAKDYGPYKRVMKTVLAAIDKHEVCSVTYKAIGRDKPKTYDIHPLTLMEYDNGLYIIVAVPKHGGDIRVLAIDRIHELTAKVDKFTPPVNYDPHALFANSFGIIIEEPIEVVLRFSKKAGPYIRERCWGKNQTIVNDDSGGGVLQFKASGREEIKRWILSFGGEVEVQAPEELVFMVTGELKSLNNIYDMSQS